MRRLLVVASLSVLGLAAAPLAHAVAAASAGDGTANPDGTATVPVTITCDPGSVVLEAHLTLSQGDGSVWGMSGIANVRCTGRPRTYLVTVRPTEGAFAAGAAYASPYVLVQDRRTGGTQSGGTASTITLG